MKNLPMYDKAHIFVSAIRILEYRKEGFPPSPSELSEFLNVSIEEILLVSRKLEEAGIIKTIEKSQGVKISIEDHTLIESLSKEKETNMLDSQLKEFQKKQKNKSKEIEEFQKKQKEKQQQLFEKLNRDLKLKS